MAPKKTVTCDRYLVDVDPITGFKFLAHAKGEEITVEEYERLKPLNPAATVAQETTAPDSEEKKPKATLPQDMTVGQLIVEAKRLGLEHIPRKKDELLAAVLEATAKADAGEKSDEGKTEADGDAGEKSDGEESGKSDDENAADKS